MIPNIPIDNEKSLKKGISSRPLLAENKYRNIENKSAKID
jgi:hypothetical protein